MLVAEHSLAGGQMLPTHEGETMLGNVPIRRILAMTSPIVHPYLQPLLILPVTRHSLRANVSRITN